jgi:demethylmenaquinone methyltransferase/2-methoxy-6-polyprenyl-1,4-benzoquinol methylase
MSNSFNQTDFGFKQVPIHQKQKLVGHVFDSVATQYDVMNDVMSMGIHRLWKQHVIQKSAVRLGQNVLDLAGGTGDLTALYSKIVGEKGNVILGDINNAMLKVGRDRMIDKGLTNIHYVQLNAETLPFKENTFHCVTMAFGLRNVTHKEKALASIYRVLKPGGRLLVLEFSKPIYPSLSRLYDYYSFKCLPKIGKWITGDEESYRYLAESIRMHPSQIQLQSMFEKANFEECDYQNLTGGIVALHSGFKF